MIYLRAGGRANVPLAPGNYRVERYNPRTAESSKFSDATGGVAWTSPAVPDTENWVFVLEIRR